MASFAHKPTIRGSMVVLRPIVAADAEHMWRDLHDAEANRLTGTHDTFTVDQIEHWAASRADVRDRLDLAVVDSQSGEWFGEVVINEWDADNRSCSFRIALGSHARNRGLGSEATRLIVDYVFDSIDDPSVNRLALEVYAFNPRAIAVYERCGFQREGVSRETLRWNGQYVDAITMSIIRSDRPRRQS